ncbi:hypothetical protein SRRS_06810 [Sporomusa rhizae]|uniref:hypothetical protein n=1 Tax=Sporomusa rhizae TaxID=357999 RepID=UPI00352B9310
MEPAFETIAAFAKRVNLPDGFVRRMVKQGELPCITTGKTHVKIHIEAALEAIRQYAERKASELQVNMPIPINLANIPQLVPRSERKHKGRPPDAVRLGRKAK